MAAFSAGNEHLLIASALSSLPTGYLSVVLCAWSPKVAKTRFPPISHFDPKTGFLATPPPRGTKTYLQLALKWLLGFHLIPPEYGRYFVVGGRTYPRELGRDVQRNIRRPKKCVHKVTHKSTGSRFSPVSYAFPRPIWRLPTFLFLHLNYPATYRRRKRPI